MSSGDVPGVTRSHAPGRGSCRAARLDPCPLSSPMRAYGRSTSSSRSAAKRAIAARRRRCTSEGPGPMDVCCGGSKAPGEPEPPKPPGMSAAPLVSTVVLPSSTRSTGTARPKGARAHVRRSVTRKVGHDLPGHGSVHDAAHVVAAARRPRLELRLHLRRDGGTAMARASLPDCATSARTARPATRPRPSWRRPIKGRCSGAGMSDSATMNDTWSPYHSEPC